MGLKAAFISIGVVMMILSMRFLYISLHFLKSKTLMRIHIYKKFGTII